MNWPVEQVNSSLNTGFGLLLSLDGVSVQRAFAAGLANLHAPD
jgi:hypothetical protein